MTTDRRFERELPSLLEDLYLGPTPEYRNDVLAAATHVRQRPAWMIPERWLPVSDITSRPAFVPRLPLRTIGVALIIVALLVAGVIVVGSRQTKVPPPFGVAQNGLVAFVDATGAIVTADPATGDSAVIVPGPGHDRPTFSSDGTRLVFLQSDALGAYDLVVTDPRGNAPRTITMESLLIVEFLAWSPDGSSVVVSVPPDRILFFDASRQAPPRVLTEPDGAPLEANVDGWNRPAHSVFRPPAGDELLFVAGSSGTLGLYAIRSDGTGRRTIIDAGTAGPTIASIEVPEWSPDGTRIVVSLSEIGEGDTRRLWIVNADGTGLRPLTHGPDSRDEGHPQWSPDGTKVAFQRGVGMSDGSYDVRPITVVDVETGVETEPGDVSMNGYRGWTWSPDGRSILMVPDFTSQIVVEPLDPSAPPVLVPTWTSPGTPSWQRTALD